MILEKLPYRDTVKIGICTFRVGLASLPITIRHTLVVHDIVIFFGEMERRPLHGYCDYESGSGRITYDE